MSQPPPSSPVPSGYPPGQPPIPQKYRPSAWWFVLGGGLVVAALLAGIGLFVWTLSAFFQTDASLPADGAAHQVGVGTDGDRLLWRDSAVFDPGCVVVDDATGQEIDLRPVTSQMTKDFGEGEWTAAYRFDPGSGSLEVTCTAGGGVQIGPAPSVAGFVGGIIATIAVPSLLGLFGLATLIVTGIMWASRPARPKG
ncbi:hypothetical protein ASC77_04490 [Nocardioides sp. Root1257]|uniref:hypothetical protein n=1 Tax=unclassified Nocardioides TaxID=2615069 RepID=UPI0006F4ECD9|nr:MULTISPECIES: hypothetical protein [unclassified Nocardioides]KQW53537.1 hypothetical protein ASC77_04490 [Nocardioides sp. Root1257]KRC56223.1 hypothetical protein ASE24_04490 [Nocardioides sp. Root224]